MARKQIWEELEARNYMMPAKRRGTKAEDVLQPFLRVHKKLADIINTERCSLDEFPETYNLNQLAKYQSEPTRVVNNSDILISFVESAKRTFAKKGRKMQENKAVERDFEERLRTLQMYEKACKHFSDFTIPSALSSPARRRTTKSHGSADSHTTELTKAQVSFKYPDDREVRRRRYVRGIGAQSCAQRLQTHLL